MATLSIVEQGVMGDLKYCIADYTGPSAYVTGGDAVTAADFGMQVEILHMSIQANDATAADLRLFVFDTTNSKIMIFTDIDTITQAANDSDQDAVTARLFVLGR